MLKNCLKMAFFSLFVSVSCFATELILVDSQGTARSYMVNPEAAQNFNPLQYSSEAPARAIFINSDVVTVQEYQADANGIPIMNVTIYNKFPSN